MLKVHVDSQISLDLADVIEGIANLEEQELEEFADKILDLRAERRSPSVPHSEAELLEKINNGVPPDVRQRYEQLMQKLLDEQISPEEHKEYLTLIEQIKISDAQRMQSIMELATLRNRSVDTIMDELGLRQVSYA